MNPINATSKELLPYLTKDEVRVLAPVVFETTPTNPKVSNKYLHVNTETIIDDLEKLGWKPVGATMRKSKGKSTIFSKHLVTFQNQDISIRGKNGDDAYPQILLINSHDGFNSFQFSVGIFRMVCSNGLVIADESFSDFRIKHKGYTFQELRNVVTEAMKDLPSRVEVLNKMSGTILTQDQKEKLALDAMLLRAGVDLGSPKAKEFEYDKETLTEILEPSRDVDKGDDLWKVFNVVQERIIKGGFQSALKGEGRKVRKVRKITSFEKDIELNKQLFKLAVSML